MRFEARHTQHPHLQQLTQSREGEEAPLLATLAVSNTIWETPESSISPPILGIKINWRTLTLVGVLALIVEAGNAMRTAPLIASYEDILCADAFSLHDNPYGHCLKDHAVASELALILGISQFLECIPAALLSGLYGNLADRHGRRPILCLSYLGVIMSASWITGVVRLAPVVPLRFVWLGPAFTIIGGGPSVSTSILMTSAADVILSAERASVYSFIHATSLIAVILGSTLSSLLMLSLNNSTPLLMGLGVMCPALFLGIFLPNNSQNCELDSIVSEPCPSAAQDDRSPLALSETYRWHIMGILRGWNKARSLWQKKCVMPLLVSGFFSMLGQQVQVLVIQYMSAKFNMSKAKANAINILNFVVNLFVLFFFLPLASNFLLRRCGYTTACKDLALAHLSCLLFIAGAMVLSIAPDVPIFVSGIILFGTGIGLSSLLRSIFVGEFPTQQRAFATSLISSVKTVGGSLSGPIYSYAFALSVDMTGLFQGWPFLLSAMCFVIVEAILVQVGGTVLLDAVKRAEAREESPS